MEFDLPTIVFAVVFLLLLFSGIAIPFAIAASAMLFLVMDGGIVSLKALGLVTWGSSTGFALTAIPLFVLMAELLLRSGVSDRVYQGLAVLFRWLPGGLLQSNIAGSAFFSAVSGSSVTTAAALGTVALPQLKQQNYDMRMAYGSLAAGGTLGILIPPSIALILYGAFTETSIARLFMAGMVPGLLLAACFSAYIFFAALRKPSIAPSAAGNYSLRIIVKAVVALIPIATLIVMVLGGIYLGVMTPTEAGAVGALLALGISLIWGNLSLAVFWDAVQRSVRLTCSLLFIVISAFIFSYAVESAGLGTMLAEWLISMELSQAGFLLAMLVVYIFLGCVIDGVGMMVLTVPLIFPTLLALGIDPVWFGVAMVLLIEIGQITPPLGLNLFVIQGISNCPLGEVIKGVIPYYGIMLCFLLVIYLLPDIVLWLPGQM
ncbi:MAG: TRAP transporter large permease [Rhodovibrionaceae bacterium]